MIRNGITIELDLPYQVREIILARPFVGRNGLGGGSFLRQKKTNEQNDSVLLRFVKPFNLFFKYCVGHFSTSLSFKGIAPQTESNASIAFMPRKVNGVFLRNTADASKFSSPR